MTKKKRFFTIPIYDNNSKIETILIHDGKIASITTGGCIDGQTHDWSLEIVDGFPKIVCKRCGQEDKRI
jgi:hypothetical protein